MISIIENIPALPDGKRKYVMDKKYTIAVAGTGYVGLSIATLLSQHHKVYAVDFVVIAAPTNVYSTNHIDVATSKRTCFAHYIGR